MQNRIHWILCRSNNFKTRFNTDEARTIKIHIGKSFKTLNYFSNDLKINSIGVWRQKNITNF